MSPASYTHQRLGSPCSVCVQLMAGSGEVRVPPRLASAAGPSTGGAPWSGSANGCALSHEELEFIAEEELVTVVPLFHAPRLQLLSGTVGAFRAQARVSRRLARRVARRLCRVACGGVCALRSP